MGEDVSLDEFVGDDADPDGVTPATTTYTWTAEGAACAACGEVVERRWQQSGTLVCSACKSWDQS